MSPPKNFKNFKLISQFIYLEKIILWQARTLVLVVKNYIHCLAVTEHFQ